MCYQGYSAENFIRIIPKKDRKEAADNLMTFAQNIGAPAELVLDHIAELVGPQCKFAEKAKFFNSKQLSCEPYTQR